MKKAIITAAALIGVFLLAALAGCDFGGDDTAAPTASLGAGAYAAGTEVELSTATAGAEIWYTVSGATPAKNGTDSAKYETPIPITAGFTLRAIAVIL
jgi:hypothetical protein